MTDTKYILLALFGILALSGTAMFWASTQESAIMDELPHIPSGYSYVRFLDYRLNPEHPPLMKALSGIPLLFTDINFPTNHKSWTKDVNGQWDAGTEFLYRSGNNADKIVFLARIAPIILTLLTILITYFFAREIIGKKWALLPAFLVGLSPTVLAHGHYVTTDLAAAFGTLLSTYAFTSLLLKPSKKKTVLSGLALGVAQLMKFSNALLLPFFLLITISFALADYLQNRGIKGERFPRRKWKSYILAFVFTVVIAYALVYAVYFVLTLNYPTELQIRDTEFTLQSFPYRPAIDAVEVMAGNPVTRPIAQYMLGLFMVLQRASGGNTGYFLGEISATGWWYYFPTVFLLKEPLPSLILVFVAFIFSLFSVFNRGGRGYFRKLVDYVCIHFQEFAMFLFILIYWGWSMKSNLNIGVRHLIPTLPFIYILTSSSIKKLIESGSEGIQGRKLTYLLSEKIVGPLFRHEINAKRLKYFGLGIALFWLVAEVGVASPYYISYFNEIGGGVNGGYRYVTDSNYDWGQDMKRLQKWAKENVTGKIAIDYFGGGNPEYYIGAKAVSWSSGKGNPADENIEWLAVSVNTLSQSMAVRAHGFSRDADGEYKFLRARNPNFTEGMEAVPTPDAKAGTSIFLYRLR